MKKAEFIKLKVFKNKRTGQASVVLPKKILKKIPKHVKLKW
ncbi:MAG: hypothetical protein ACOC5T_02180 [Elusimicrobiota bacterium]